MNQKKFSHIYVEHQIRAHEDVDFILKRFKPAAVIEIEHYKDLFNRARQDWRGQKKSQSLILARRLDNFLYPASCPAGAGAEGRFGSFYSSLVLNCIFDCDYCYLQGLYPSANMVMFLNNEDYFSAVRKELEKGPFFLCLSYDTDLLAIEEILPYCRRWIEFSAMQPGLSVELRTKSANFAAISGLPPAANFTLAWTLSPKEVAGRYEQCAPGLEARLESIKQACQKGWPVRLCFEPLLLVPGWKAIYQDFVRRVFESLGGAPIKDACLGVFRMNTGFLERIQKQRDGPDILFYPFRPGSTQDLATYPEQEKEALESCVRDTLEEYLPPEKILIETQGLAAIGQKRRGQSHDHSAIDAEMVGIVYN